MDQHHQHQTSHQTQARPTETALGSQFLEAEQLLSEIKELKATVVKSNENKISLEEQKVNSLTEVQIVNSGRTSNSHKKGHPIKKIKKTY